MADDEVFSQLNKKREKLVEADFSFEFVMNNPILKPISEADKRISDLEEMISKKAEDAIKDKAWINDCIESVPAYSTSNFVGRVINMNKALTDMIKLQDIINSTLKETIKEIYNLVNSGIYGLRIEEEMESKKEKAEKKEKINFDYISYLKSIIEVGGTEAEIAKIILERIEKDTSKKSINNKFDDVCIALCKDEQDKPKKRIMSDILGLKLNPQEVKHG